MTVPVREAFDPNALPASRGEGIGPELVFEGDAQGGVEVVGALFGGVRQ